MNDLNFKLAESFISKSYSSQALQVHKTNENLITSLLSSRRLPNNGWADTTIQLFISELSSMDSNNFPDNIGVGERESRIYSNLVKSRHFNFGHGMGRSGEIAAIQPKAAGSSLIVKLTNLMVLDSMQIAGIKNLTDCIVLPLATGMSLTLSLLTLKTFRPKTAKYVLWPRIDQKTCFKSIITAGFECIVIENALEGDEVRTNLESLEETINKLGVDNIVCILSTSSCFAPRAPDKVVEIAKLCLKYGIGHIINNAYGIQCESTCKMLNKAGVSGRVDCIVQSTDKNYMVPVGGGIVSSFKPEIINELSKNYPGRASISPILDIFITLLSMGANGWKKLLQCREQTYFYFREKLIETATLIGERVLETPSNPISLCLSLTSSITEFNGPNFLGSMLFSRLCSGVRIVDPRDSYQSLHGHDFISFGSHINNYNIPYLTVAAAIGMSKDEVDEFCTRLLTATASLKKKINKNNTASIFK